MPVVLLIGDFKMAKTHNKRIGGLWKSKTKNGDVYLSISLGGQQYVAFKNNFKEKDTDPDYNIYPKQNRQQSTNIRSGRTVKPNDDEIPF